jgi:hypothetical protein
MQPNPTKTGNPAAQGAKYRRDAIVFLPAIGRAWDDPSIEGIARRIANVIDTGARYVKAKAKVRVQDQTYGDQGEFKTRVCTVFKTEDDKDSPVIDIYGMDYAATLTSHYQDRSLLYKSLFVALMIIRSFPLAVAQFWRAGKTVRENIQLAYGAAILSLLVVYMCSLVYAGYSSYKLLKDPVAATTSTPAPAQASVSATDTAASPNPSIRNKLTSFISNRASVIFPVFIVALSALGVVWPKGAKFRESITDAATYALCLISYLTSGERSNAIAGKLDRLIEYIAEKEDLNYRHIHVIGYSFGSIVTLDALFPSTRTPGPRFEKIHTLVTIGCPYDIVRNYYPGYFSNRTRRSNIPRRWFNVYTPVDVLSSNFSDDGGVTKATRTIELRGESNEKLEPPINILYAEGAFPKTQLSIWDVVMLMGFRSHTIYWGPTYESEITCFHQIIPEMYGDDPLLSFEETARAAG